MADVGPICWVEWKPTQEDGVQRVGLLKINDDCDNCVIMYKREFIKTKLSDVTFRSWE